VPAILLDVPRGGFHGLRIELKREKGSYPTEDQKEWLRRLREYGYCACVCRGFDHARQTIENYLDGRENDGE